jgi:hypothetical protein
VEWESDKRIKTKTKTKTMIKIMSMIMTKLGALGLDYDRESGWSGWFRRLALRLETRNARAAETDHIATVVGSGTGAGEGSNSWAPRRPPDVEGSFAERAWLMAWAAFELKTEFGLTIMAQFAILASM